MIITISITEIIGLVIIAIMFVTLIVLYVYESIKECLEKRKNKK